MKTEHEYPILGLYPNYKNEVELEYKFESGKIIKKNSINKNRKIRYK